MSAEKPSKRPVIWSNLNARFFSAILFSAICIPPFYFGGLAWAILIGLIGLRVVWEWVRMSDQSPNVWSYIIPITGLIIAMILLRLNHVSVLIAAVFGFAALAGIERLRRRGAIWAALGYLYVVIPCLFAVFIRGDEVGIPASGFKTLLFVILVVVAADTGAYFGGSWFKGPKMAPKLSPKKTWSGFFSGAVFSILIGGIVAKVMGFSAMSGAIWATPIMFFAVLGDFFESMLKRRLDVKDAGGVLPGHGGLLDRMDSMMGVVTLLGLLLLTAPHLWPIQ